MWKDKRKGFVIVSRQKASVLLRKIEQANSTPNVQPLTSEQIKLQAERLRQKWSKD